MRYKMQQTNSRFFSLMVVGEQPNELVKKYDKASKIEPYVKYKYLNAKKYQDNAIKVLTKLLENKDVVGLQPTMKESLEKRLETLQMLTPFEYYRELTDGMYYNEDGDALCDDNPNGKYNTCKIGRNFAPPLKLKDGTESYQALAKNVDWEAMNGLNKGIYEAAWELVVEGREPINEEEKSIYESMKDKVAYFSNFKSKENYVTYSTAYWNYAYADKDGWCDVDDANDEERWINDFFPRFVEKLNPNDLVTIFECSVNNDD